MPPGAPQRTPLAALSEQAKWLFAKSLFGPSKAPRGGEAAPPFGRETRRDVCRCDFRGDFLRLAQDTAMRWFRRGSADGVASAWGYLLRVTTRGFFGELSLGIVREGKSIARRLRLAARMFSPRPRPPVKRSRVGRGERNRRDPRGGGFVGELAAHPGPSTPPLHPSDPRFPSSRTGKKSPAHPAPR